MEPSQHATTQYVQTSSKLADRMGILNYDTHAEHWYSWVRSHIPLHGDILEVGAGTGALWKDFDNSNIHLTLTDFSPAMCERLSEVPGATIKQCNASSIPLPDASFDVAIANHMLYHVDDPDEALKELARVLRPGGKLIVTLNGRDHIQEILEIGEKIGRTSVILKRARITAESAPEHIEKFLTLVSAERVPGSFEISDADPVLHYLDSWGENKLDETEAAKARSLVESVVASKGRFIITKNMVLFTAQKD